MLSETNSVVVTEPETEAESNPCAPIECQLAAGFEGEHWVEGLAGTLGGEGVQASSSIRRDVPDFVCVEDASGAYDVNTQELRLTPRTIGWGGGDEKEENENLRKDEKGSQAGRGVSKGGDLLYVLGGQRGGVYLDIVEKEEADLAMNKRVDEVVEEEEEEEEEEQNEDQEDHRGHEEVDDDDEEEVGEEKDDNGDEDDDEEEEDEEMHPLQLVVAEERMDGGDDEEEEAGEDDELQSRDGSQEEQIAFTKTLKQFFKERRMEYKAPKFYGEELNVLKLWRAVTSLGGYDQVTAGKLWRKVGEQFQPPKTCTTLSWSFRGFYEKALLDYERFQRGHPFTAVSHPDGTISGIDSQAMSPNTPSSQPSSTPASGSGRARRDAATRAMHGWHARLGNGEVGDSIIKEKMGAVTNKKEKPLKNLVGGKRKDSMSAVERAMKVARSKGSKGNKSLSLAEVPGKPLVNSQGKTSANSKKGPKMERTKPIAKVNNAEPALRGLKLNITDDGPPADWVKINAYRNSEGYEIYALVPGLAREEVRIQCEEGGRVVICGSPEQPNNPWGVTAFRKVVNLPSKIDAHHTSAVVTLYGQLFVRVPYAHPHMSF